MRIIPITEMRNVRFETKFTRKSCKTFRAVVNCIVIHDNNLLSKRLKCLRLLELKQYLPLWLYFPKIL